MSNLKGKFILTVEGDVEPLFATQEQWYSISKELKKGPCPLQTSNSHKMVFAVLEVCKGYQGTGISNSRDGIMMCFGKIDGN